ncbi:MAG TPA: hypothetical protein VMU80_15090 [Bryobacteraceae bacterium]|nr:hypothetical protein [Bryobacteraceae bacterium]
MFTWICPTCGREVPPAYDECPDCAAKGIKPEQAPPPVVQAGAPAPAAENGPAIAVAPPVQAPPAQMLAYGPPPPRAGMPTWLLTILFAFAFVGVGAGIYWAINYFRGGSGGTSVPVETAAVKEPAKEHPLQKYVEVTGIRFLENDKHDIEARFVVVNHSGADISDLAGTVNIWGRTAKSEEEAAGSFQFKMPSLGPYESKDAVSLVRTKLKAYELPDWQNVSAEVQITSP